MDFTLKIKMNKAPGKNGKALLYLQAFINGEKSIKSIGLSIEPQYFDKKTGLVKESYEFYNDLNIVIRSKISKANGIASRYRILEETSGIILSKKLFEREMYGTSSKGDFLAWYDKRLKYRIEKKIIEKDTTGKNERTTYNKLKEFRPAIRFCDLNHEFIDDLVLWMKNKGNKHNTRWQLLKNLHSYCDIALEEGLIINHPMDNFQNNAEEGPTVFLNIKEVNTLIKYSKENKTPDDHKVVLKYFLFACFTGLRISDTKRINFANIANGSLVFVPKKGSSRKAKILNLPLSTKAKNFITSMRGKEETDSIFNTYEDPVTNRKLKEIATACKIKKHLTFHVARHTFGTLYLELGGKVQVLQKYLGHTKITTTMRYAHVVDKEKKKEIKRFDSVFK
jgi:integrase/recombinase XerD